MAGFSDDSGWVSDEDFGKEYTSIKKTSNNFPEDNQGNGVCYYKWLDYIYPHFCLLGYIINL